MLRDEICLCVFTLGIVKHPIFILRTSVVPWMHEQESQVNPPPEWELAGTFLPPGNVIFLQDSRLPAAAEGSVPQDTTLNGSKEDARNAQVR